MDKHRMGRPSSGGGEPEPRGSGEARAAGGASCPARLERAPRAGRIAGALVALALCAVPPVFVNDAVGYVPLVAYVVLVALCWAYLQVVARHVDCTQNVQRREVTRGHEGELAVSVRNTGALVMPRVEPSFIIERDDGDVQELRARSALAPRQDRAFSLGVGFDHVGTYEVGLRSVELFDPLGLTSRVVPVGRRCRVRVVPRVVPVGDTGASDPSASDVARSVRTVMSDDMDYSCVRAYQMGDPMKKVHWKMSARAEDSLYTKLFESSTNPGLTVALDFFTTEADAELRASLFDTMLEVAFSLLDHAGRTGVATTLAFCDRSGAARRIHACSPGELNPLVDDMPRLSGDVPARRASDMIDEDLSDAGARANLVFVATGVSRDMAETLRRQIAARRDVRVLLAVPEALTASQRRERLAAVGQLTGDDVRVSCVGDASELSRGVR
ncbi:MAG: DUF58 domain-containing protein [Coriobacteriia bacterium]|nr:DUF58 domain-containing protein [Coriobacteriia bacterium]MBS5477981.1 DUF58 domain-containing protein [Coriobacteriia bacterium]